VSDNKEEVLAEVTRTVMNLLDAWKLSSDQMRYLLALPESAKARVFIKYRDQKESFPDDPDVMRRSKLLMRIADAVRTAYPMNPKMVERWVNQKQRRMGGRTPMMLMLDDGEAGMVSVLSEIDCTFSWDLTGSKAVTASH